MGGKSHELHELKPWKSAVIPILNVSVNQQPAHMTSIPVVLSPALPSELLTHILNFHVYPTTLIICSTKSDFMQSLTRDMQHQDKSSQNDEASTQQQHPDGPNTQEKLDTRIPPTFLSSPLYQVAISRHIRTAYIPTVTHLRAYLSVMSADDSGVTPPPSSFAATVHKAPHLIIYGAIDLHRDTSEWSAQGLSNTAATLVETGHRMGWQVVMIEPRKPEHGMASYQELLEDTLPMLSGGARRMGLDSDEGGWVGRTVVVGKVLSRWFRFQRGS